MIEELILTKEEDESTRYCDDFCPIYDAIKQYNKNHLHIIYCPEEMCDEVIKEYILNKRYEKEKSKNKEE